MIDKQVAVVFQTTDYQKFKLMEKGNRDIDHVDKIVRSMKEKALFTIILVNDKFEIIDGQNRFLALKALGLPINYTIVHGYGIEETRFYNMEAKNWSKKDFLKSYADQGVDEYVKIKQFSERYNDFPISTIEMILRLAATNDSSDKRNPNTFHAFKRGIFKTPNIEKSEVVAQSILKFRGLDKNPVPIYRRKEFVVAIIKLAREKNFDVDMCVKNIKSYPNMFHPCVNSNEYIQQLEKIQNYRSRNKVRFNV